MQVEYNDVIEFQKPFSMSVVDNKYLVVFPEYMNYFVTDELGYRCFEMLYNEKSIGDVFSYYQEHCNVPDEEIAVTQYQKLLSDIFYANKKSEPFDTDDDILDLKFDVTYHCNAQCVHCFATEFPEMARADLESWKKIFDELTNVFEGEPRVAISGGEPLIETSFLVDFIEYIRPRTTGITLLTNGFIFSDWIDNQDPRMEFFLNNIDDFQISLDGFTEEIYDSIRGEGNFRKVMNTLLFLNEKGKSLSIHTTIHRINYRDARENMIAFLKKYKQLVHRKNHFSFSIARAVGRGKILNENGLLCTYVEFEKMLYDVYEQLLANDICDATPRPITYRDICGIGKQITISPNGNCYLCGIPTSDILGNVLKDGHEHLRKKTLETRRLYDLDHFDSCKGCDVKGLCMGGCRVYNKTIEGDYCKPTCNDDYKESVYRMLIREFEIGNVNI